MFLCVDNVLYTCLQVCIFGPLDPCCPYFVTCSLYNSMYIAIQHGSTMIECLNIEWIYKIRNRGLSILEYFIGGFIHT